jgi:hypothetical protein
MCLAGFCENVNEHFGFIKDTHYLNHQIVSVFQKECAPWT